MQQLAKSIDVTPFIGDELVGETFDEFVDALHEKLPGARARQPIEESCLCLLGETLTAEALRTLCWRLVGNSKRLKGGFPVLPWDGQVAKEWVPVQVLASRFTATRRGKHGAVLDLKVLAGQSCPETTTVFWTTAYCHTFVSRMGFTRSYGKYPFEDIRQLVNFRFLIEVIPDIPELKFSRIHVPATLKEWNKKLIRRRARETFKCPKKFPLSHPCHLCHVGQDQCSVATHAQTFEKRQCDECERNQFFDPAYPLMCIACRQREILQRGKNV